MTATAATNSALGHILFDAMNARDLSIWEAALAPDATFSYPGLRGDVDRQTAIAFNAVFPPAMSDLHFEITRTIVAGDTVVCCWVGRGTHDGPLALPTGIVPPTGRRGDIPGVSVVTVRDGKIAREETYWNQVELLAQLGLL
jgi:steroid delta-isomerase-like uncharacterized protein